MKTPKTSSKLVKLSNEKVAAIRSMIKLMPKKDQDYLFQNYVEYLNKSTLIGKQA
jgi:hypothetical protein